MLCLKKRKRFKHTLDKKKNLCSQICLGVCSIQHVPRMRQEFRILSFWRPGVNSFHLVFSFATTLYLRTTFAAWISPDIAKVFSRSRNFVVEGLAFFEHFDVCI